MSRNALIQFVLFLWLAGEIARAGNLFSFHSTNTASRVVIVENTNAVSDFAPDADVVQQMVNHGIIQLSGKTNLSSAWRDFISTNDIVGVKVFSSGGEISGTRPAVAAAVVRGLLGAGISKDHIVIWDKRADDLRAAGFFTLGQKLGVRVAGCVETGYDPTNFYLPDNPVIGTLRYGDLEFGKKGEGVGRKSFVAKLVSRRFTKIISIAPLLNDNDIGVSGQLYSVALGSVDNTFRFEGDAGRLAIAVPEIYALRSVGDKVVLNITDALLGQYEGGDKGLLQYSKVLDQLWFSRDPVALDTLAVEELKRERRERGAPEIHPDLEVYTNAALLELGQNDLSKIQIEKVR